MRAALYLVVGLGLVGGCGDSSSAGDLFGPANTGGSQGTGGAGSPSGTSSGTTGSNSTGGSSGVGGSNSAGVGGNPSGAGGVSTTGASGGGAGGASGGSSGTAVGGAAGTGTAGGGNGGSGTAGSTVDGGGGSGTAGSGGRTVDAGRPDAPALHPILCGTTTCEAPTQFCCIPNNNNAPSFCAVVGSIGQCPNNADSVFCDDRTDCPTLGEICCAADIANGSSNATCVAPGQCVNVQNKSQQLCDPRAPMTCLAPAGLGSVCALDNNATIPGYAYCH